MLTEQREKIDQIDRELVNLLEERMKTVTEIVQIKLEAGIAVLDAGREAQVIEKINHYVSEADYRECISEVYQAILASSKKYQGTVIEVGK